MKTVRLLVEDGVGTIVLDRPASQNAIDRVFTEEFLSVVTACDEREDVRCVLIRADGPMFTAGGDLSSFRRLDGPELSDLLRTMTTTYHEALQRLSRMDAPVVAAVDGPAAGGGLGIVLAADVVIASSRSNYTLGYCALGLTADGGTTWFLPRIVGLRLAQRMFLLNEQLDADTALAVGLVSELAEDANDRARELAQRLASGPTAAFGDIKRLLQDASTTSLGDHLDAEARSVCRAAGSRDGLEGIAAFLDERRPPNFEGR